MRYLVANWKMNLPPEGITGYMTALRARAASETAVVIAPPFPYLRDLTASERLFIGAQNCGDQKSGAFTGEVSAAMLKDAGASFAIVGHSERRNVYGESDALIARRMAMAIEGGLTPVFCIGEQLRAREADTWRAF